MPATIRPMLIVIDTVTSSAPYSLASFAVTVEEFNRQPS